VRGQRVSSSRLGGYCCAATRKSVIFAKPTYIFASRGEFKKCYVVQEGMRNHDSVKNKIYFKFNLPHRERLLNNVL